MNKFNDTKPESKFEDVPEEVLTDPTMRTALGMDPIPGMNTPVDEPTIFTNSSSSSTATPEVKVFKNPVHPEFGELRVLEIDDELWFIGKEVANALGYKDLKNAVKAHVNAEDRKLLLRGQNTPLEIPNRGSYHYQRIRPILSHPQQQTSISKRVQALGYIRGTPLYPQEWCLYP